MVKEFFKTKIDEAEFRKVCNNLIQSRGKQWQIKDHVLKGNLWWIDFGEDCYNKAKEQSQQAVKEALLKMKKELCFVNCGKCGHQSYGKFLNSEYIDEIAKEDLGIDLGESK